VAFNIIPKLQKFSNQDERDKRLSQLIFIQTDPAQNHSLFNQDTIASKNF